MRRTVFLTSIVLTVGLVSSTPTAYADTVTLTLTNQTQYYVGIGSTLTFDATVTAPDTNLADVYLIGDSFNVDFPLTVDDSAFLYTFPFVVAPGTSVSGDLFSVFIPAGTAQGTYTGYFAITDGTTPGNVLASEPFSVVVTPEPSSFLLLGSAIAGIVAAVKRKRTSCWDNAKQRPSPGQ